MTNALAERPAPSVTAEELDLVKRTVASGATDAELKLFLYDCQRQGVHPLDKLLHFTKRGGKYTPVTSIDLMRTHAADTGEYAGSDDAEPGPTVNEGHPQWSTVTVWRLVQGQRCAFTATARWDEYYPGDGPAGQMWRKMPHTMLGKCAEALALRKGFPRQLAGLYAREELDQAERSASVSVTPDPPDTVLDTTTGEAVPAAHRPPAPQGYAYIDWYNFEGDYHHVGFFVDGLGSALMKYKTKLAHIGDVAAQAYQLGVPVKYTVKGGRAGEEGWLQGCEMWKPEPKPTPSTLPPMTADEVF